MTDDEWSGLCLFMEHGFKGDLDAPARATYRLFLNGFSPEEVMAGLHKLVSDGQVWLPKPGEIVTAIQSLREPPVPAWPEVWTWLQRGMRWVARDGEEAALLRVAEGCHPVVARFAEAEGGLVAMSREPYFDPQYGGLRIKELKGRWEEFVEVARERLARGEALAAAQGRRGLGPAKLSTTALLDGMNIERPAIGPGGADDEKS